MPPLCLNMSKCIEYLCVVRANKKPWMTWEVLKILEASWNVAFKTGNMLALTTARANLKNAIKKAKKAHTQKIQNFFQARKTPGVYGKAPRPLETIKVAPYIYVAISRWGILRIKAQTSKLAHLRNCFKLSMVKNSIGLKRNELFLYFTS